MTTTQTPRQHIAQTGRDHRGYYVANCPDCGWTASTFSAFKSEAGNLGDLRRTVRSHRNAAMKADEKAAAKAGR